MPQAATNRLKYMLAAGTLGTPTAADIRMGLLTVFAGVTNVPDINFIADMESHADFAEATSGAISGYARVALTNETATESDASDWALWDCDDVAFGALDAGGTIVGWFVYREGASDAAREVLAIGSLTSTPTNGSTFTVTTASGLFQIT